MKLTQQLDLWSAKFRSGLTDCLRIVLGLIILVKGFEFLFDMAGMVQTMQVEFGFSNIVIVQILAGIHLYFGFFILLGLMTRLSSAVLIPIVTIATVYVNVNFANSGIGEFLLSAVTLCLLLFFFIYGNGDFSVYRFWMDSKRSRLTDASIDESERMQINAKPPFLDFNVPNE